MPILFQERITRADLQKNPERLYVFGDNLAGKGYGGLARECRGEPNAIGIATKRAPSMNADAFFSDADFDLWERDTFAAWNRLWKAILAGTTVVFPKAGIGTGLARLPICAPRIKAGIDKAIARLQEADSRVQTDARYARKVIRRS